jgi:hypothetical protein
MGAVERHAVVTTVKPVRFDEAWRRAQAWAHQRLAGCLGQTVLVRDVFGRVRVVLDDRGGTSDLPTEEQCLELAQEFVAELQHYAPKEARDVFLRASQMFAPQDLFASADILPATGAAGVAGLRTLERLLVGADWLRPPVQSESRVPRLTLHGIKGGVGRSTAAAVLAWRLAAERGRPRRVLVVDLDLESPGVGTTLLRHEAQPDFGVVDWLVEDAVGQAGRDLVDSMWAHSELAQGAGAIIVVPAVGRAREGYAFMPKLGRAYNDVVRRDGLAQVPTVATFPERVATLLQHLEELHEPDLVILDSRAGLHDIAAMAITRLGATSLLFAVDTPQTWDAYRLLFESWREHPERALAFRERLKVVAALTPETHTSTYLDALRDHAYDLFQATLYEDAAANDTAAFNFDLADDAAPHTPLRIHWARTFQQFDPVRTPDALTQEQLSSGFGDFVSGVHELVFGEGLP